MCSLHTFKVTWRAYTLHSDAYVCCIKYSSVWEKRVWLVKFIFLNTIDKIYAETRRHFPIVMYLPIFIYIYIIRIKIRFFERIYTYITSDFRIRVSIITTNRIHLMNHTPCTTSRKLINILYIGANTNSVRLQYTRSTRALSLLCSMHTQTHQNFPQIRLNILYITQCPWDIFKTTMF